MRPLLVLNVVGLAPRFIGKHMPNLADLAGAGALRPLRTITPAVTCSVQSTFTTGLMPSGHGCVGNGWFFRDLSEVALWRQSNALVAGEKIWEAGRRRDSSFTCAKLFWWFNMYSSADFSVTPRPQYPADGRKLPDVYTFPADLKDELNAQLGVFPLFEFWGPRAGLRSSRWIADCARHVFESRKPTLTMVYLPHLDYDLQRYGPDHERIAPELSAIDGICGELIEMAGRAGAGVIVLSEYGITKVSGAVHINRILRRAGLVAVRPEKMGEQLDAGASEAFAVADHQVAHVYVKRPERVAEVAKLLRATDGIEAVWGDAEKRANGLDHVRTGELVAVSRSDRWFSYYFWLDDDRAPDYARTVDIHRKPGYDPVELFLDPQLPAAKLQVLSKLLRRKMGFRTLLDVIALDDTLVKGSHGRITDDPADGPVFLSNRPELLSTGAAVDAAAVKDLILRHIFSH